MKINGFYYDRSLSDIKLAASIEFKSQQIRISAESHSLILWDLAKTKMFCGGSNNHLYFFHLFDKNEISFYAPRTKELDQFLLSYGNPSMIECVTQRKRNTQNLAFGVASIICLLVVAAVSFWSLRQHAFDLIIDKIPIEQEKALGEKLFENIAPKEKRISTTESQAILTEINKVLIDQVPEAYQDMKIVVIKGDKKNAFAVPGGYIAIYEGALKSFDNYSEFSSVMAHEMAHVYRRHSLRNIIKTVSLYLLVSSLFGDISGLVAVIADQGSFLLAKSFSRDYEQEADELAVKKLLHANIDPRGLASFFTKITKELNETQKKLENDLSFLSTHPPSKERIAFVQLSYDQLETSKKNALITKNKKFQLWKQLLLTKDKNEN